MSAAHNRVVRIPSLEAMRREVSYMSNSWRRRHRRSEEQQRRAAIEDRFYRALWRKDFAKAIEINRRELGLPEYLLNHKLAQNGWKPAPTPEERRVLIARRYGVPTEWVMLEEELASRRTTKHRFTSKLRSRLASSLLSLVSHFRYSAIPGR